MACRGITLPVELLLTTTAKERKKLMKEHTFTVTVRGCTREQAQKVMDERILHDEDYGFDYGIDYESEWTYCECGNRLETPAEYEDGMCEWCYEDKLAGMRLDSKSNLNEREKMGKTELQVKFGSQKSFYGKAQVLENGMGDKMLFSYDVPVAGVIEGEARVYNLKSATTLRHVKEFLLQNGFKAENKAQIKEDYPVN